MTFPKLWRGTLQGPICVGGQVGRLVAWGQREDSEVALVDKAGRGPAWCPTCGIIARLLNCPKK